MNGSRWSAGTRSSLLKRSHRTLTLVRLGVASLALAACSGDHAGQHEQGSNEHAVTVTQTFQDGMSSYAGTLDATMSRASAMLNHGRDTSCAVGGDDGSGTDRSCLLRWALSGMPSDAIINSASITLQVIDSSNRAYDLYAVKRDWSEDQLTWDLAATGSVWAAPGALDTTDRGAVIGTVPANSGQVSQTIVLNPVGVAMVQSWVSGANRGVIAANASNVDGVAFASSEHATVAYRPKLSITYTTSWGAGPKRPKLALQRDPRPLLAKLRPERRRPELVTP